MKELMKIKTNENGKQLVSARELHEFLEITERFTQWFTKRVEKYGFIENEDFTGVKTFTLVNNGANRELQDYVITVDMAKELSMIQNTEKGKQARRYFIECEKKLKEVTQQRLPKTYKEALLELIKAEEEKERLEAENRIMIPKAEFYDDVAGSKDAISIGEVAKMLGIRKLGRNKLFQLLRDKKILQPNNQPYQQFVDKGYFRVIEQRWTTENGETKINIKTLVYQKGLDYIRRIIKEN